MHKVTLIDSATKEGICEKCGNVTLRAYNIGSTGKLRYRCPGSYSQSASLRKRHAGLNADERTEMIEKVGKCQICQTKLTNETGRIDHDHATGDFRGVLCDPCNLGLGHFNDDVELLVRAISYLMK